MIKSNGVTQCPNCGRHCNPALTVCHVCWAKIPLELRTAIQETWRAYAADPTDENYNAYFAARDRAIRKLHANR